MNLAIRKTFKQQGAWWLPKRPPGEENDNSKLIYALLSILMIPCEDPGRTHTILKELSLYIVVTMTRNCTREGGGPHHHPLMTPRNIQSLWTI